MNRLQVGSRVAWRGLSRYRYGEVRAHFGDSVLVRLDGGTYTTVAVGDLL